MTNNENVIVYRCPSCSEAVFGSAKPFAKENGKIKLKCACGSSALEARTGDDGKVIISAPCIFCENPHSYIVSGDALLSGSFFELGCPVTGLPSVFIGPAEAVSGAVEENEKEIRRIAEEAGIDLDADKVTVDRSSIKEQLLRLLGNLKAEGRIICDCEDKDSSSLAVTVKDDGVEISCKKCGTKRFFRAMTTLDCEYLSDIDLLYLE